MQAQRTIRPGAPGRRGKLCPTHALMRAARARPERSCIVARRWTWRTRIGRAERGRWPMTRAATRAPMSSARRLVAQAFPSSRPRIRAIGSACSARCARAERASCQSCPSVLEARVACWLYTARLTGAPHPVPQVPGCNQSLTGELCTKHYHQRYRVCTEHASCPSVWINAQPHRFCQVRATTRRAARPIAQPGPTR